MTEINLPKGWTNPRIVLGYNDEIRLMVDVPDELSKQWTDRETETLRQKKIEYLENVLGYKIKPLSEIISHEQYEKQLNDVHPKVDIK